MTDFGKRWIEEQWVADATEGTKGVLFPGAEFWIRAFCDEVERRATNNAHDGWMAQGLAFTELKRELIGEESK